MKAGQHPPKPGMEEFRGKGVSTRKAKSGVDQAVGARKPSTKNDK